MFKLVQEILGRTRDSFHTSQQNPFNNQQPEWGVKRRTKEEEEGRRKAFGSMQIIRSCESHLHVGISRVTLTRRKRTRTSLFGPPSTSTVQSQVSWHDNKHFPAYRNYSNSNKPFSHRKQPRKAGRRACEHTVYSDCDTQMLAARGHGPNQTIHLITSQKNDFTKTLRHHRAKWTKWNKEKHLAGEERCIRSFILHYL